MPIRKEMRDRYPKDWKAISLEVRERAGNICEGSPAYPDCRARNGEPHPVTGGKVTLTVGHLGLPTQLPFLLQVTRYAVTDEVVDLVGLLVPVHAEGPKWHAMMDDRSATEFLRGAPASGAGFVVALPSRSTCAPPTRPIIFSSLASGPPWVRLTRWRLSAEPSKATLIPTESTPVPHPISCDGVATSTSFANKSGKAPLATTYTLVAAGHRTSLTTIRGLLRCEWEPSSANNARRACGGSSGSGHGVLYHIDDYPENCIRSNLRAWCNRCHNTYDMPMRRQGIIDRAKAADGTVDWVHDAMPEGWG